MTRRNLSRLAALLIVGVLLLPGCSNKAQRLYERAEMFLAQGQPYLAAADYYRLVTEQPRSALAADALYKLAYLQREEFNSPPKAIQTYQLLADNYPDSPYADDSLLWVLQIQGQKLKSPTAVRRTLAIIRDRFPKDERVLASAQLQLVKTLFTVGQYEQANREAQDLVRQYPQSDRQCSAALLVRAHVREKLGRPGDEEAVKLYEQIVARYPELPAAQEAKRSIGWVYYGKHNSQLAEERLAKERAAKVMGDVPMPVLVGPAHLKPFACLSALLAQRGIRATPEELLVISGGAFAFAYSPDRPGAATSLLERSALTAAAEQYGFATNVWSAPNADGSFASLAQAITEGRPAMVPVSGAGNWMIVTGYKPAEDQVYGLSPGRAQPVSMSRIAFIARWARDPGGHTACATGPYFQLSLGQRAEPPTATAVLRNVARRGAAAMNDNESEGIACGEKAYAALAEQLSGLQTRSDPAQLQHLQEWVNVSLPQFLSERRAAADYVAAAGSAAGGPAAEQAAQAAESLREMARLGMELRRELLSLLKPGAGAEPPPEASWPETAERVHQMQNADQKAQSHLAEIAR